MLKSKHVPIRKCIACGNRKDKNTLLRIVRTSKKSDANASFIIDDKKNTDGRGYYLCKDIQCIEMAKKKKRLERIFKRKISSEIYDQLKEAIQNSK